MERLLVELIERGVSLELLQELFPGSPGEGDFELLRKVRLGDRVVPQSIGANLALPQVISSGSAKIQCDDVVKLLGIEAPRVSAKSS